MADSILEILTQEFDTLIKEGDKEAANVIASFICNASAKTLERIRRPIVAKHREVLQFAIGELEEAADKLFVSYHNHPGDFGVVNKDSLAAQHRREDKERLLFWSDRATRARNQIREFMNEKEKPAPELPDIVSRLLKEGKISLNAAREILGFSPV